MSPTHNCPSTQPHLLRPRHPPVTYIDLEWLEIEAQNLARKMWKYIFLYHMYTYDLPSPNSHHPPLPSSPTSYALAIPCYIYKFRMARIEAQDRLGLENVNIYIYIYNVCTPTTPTPSPLYRLPHRNTFVDTYMYMYMYILYVCVYKVYIYIKKPFTTIVQCCHLLPEFKQSHEADPTTTIGAPAILTEH